MKVFYFLRIYRNIGHLIRMIFLVIYKMRWYFFLIFVFIFAFGNTFMMLSKANEREDRFIDDQFEGMTFVVFLQMARLSSNIGVVNQWLIWFFIIISILFLFYINLMIVQSMVKDYYDQVEFKKDRYTYRIMAQLILESYALIQKDKPVLSKNVKVAEI